MTTTTAERSAQALSISEIIEALAGIQALLAANVDSPWCDSLTKSNIGNAYYELTRLLYKQACRAGS